MRLESGATKTPSRLGTLLTRRIHFFRFLRRINIAPDDLLLTHLTHKQRVQLFAVYNADLALGHSIKGKPIEVPTMKAYIQDAASMIATYVDQDPRKDLPTDTKLSKSLHAVWKECERHATMPDLRDPYSLDMHETLMARNRSTNPASSSFTSAFEDWANVNSYLGCRLTEWAQTKRKREFAIDGGVPMQLEYIKEGRSTKKAFTLRDIQCYSERGGPVSLHDFVADRSLVHSIEITFSWQKNGKHGEIKKMTLNTVSPERCGIRSWHNIITRFAALVGLDHDDTPLCIFHENGELHFIDEERITDILESIAMETYGITRHQLQKHYRFSSHSLRIGACVMLHAAGVSATTIKFLLRWNSDAFMQYLRNVTAICETQNSAFRSDSPIIPNVF